MARACFDGPPRDETAQALRAFGLSDHEEAKAPEPVFIEVWPEHVDALLLFQLLLTQWRVGVGGAIGLDYGVIPFVAKQAGIKGKHLKRVFPQVQEMEREALAVMGERNKQKD